MKYFKTENPKFLFSKLISQVIRKNSLEAIVQYEDWTNTFQPVRDLTLD